MHGQCRATSFFNGQPPLSEGAGYAVVVGFGAFFSIFTTILVFLDYRFGGTKQTSEQVRLSAAIGTDHRIALLDRSCGRDACKAFLMQACRLSEG